MFLIFKVTLTFRKRLVSQTCVDGSVLVEYITEVGEYSTVLFGVIVLDRIAWIVVVGTIEQKITRVWTSRGAQGKIKENRVEQDYR